VDDLNIFKLESDEIIANRITEDLLDLKSKALTRDFFGGDSKLLRQSE
jgi:hypothetical protein